MLVFEIYQKQKKRRDLDFHSSVVEPPCVPSELLIRCETYPTQQFLYISAAKSWLHRYSMFHHVHKNIYGIKYLLILWGFYGSIRYLFLLKHIRHIDAQISIGFLLRPRGQMSRYWAPIFWNEWFSRKNRHGFNGISGACEFHRIFLKRFTKLGLCNIDSEVMFVVKKGKLSKKHLLYDSKIVNGGESFLRRLTHPPTTKTPRMLNDWTNFSGAPGTWISTGVFFVGSSIVIVQ